MRRDLERLWSAGRLSFGVMCVFFAIAILGPAASIWLAYMKGQWQYLWASPTMAAVPLAAGLALLRNERHLREQYQSVAAEIARLDRFDIGLDYAMAESEATYRAALRRVVESLLSTELPREPIAAPKHSQTEAGEPLRDEALTSKFADAITSAPSLAAQAVGDAIKNLAGPSNPRSP